jgi:hypothetical protein
METKERIQSLRNKATQASKVFMAVVQSVGVFQHVADEDRLIHDNVKIIEADTDDFDFELDVNKQQVVIVLEGQWGLNDGHDIRTLEVSDVVKIPRGNALAKRLTTCEKGSKFVYVQFR